ncbi:uncharacterized protein LOC143049932 isoform X2 [Mytilus galloprovincialis]|uniref:uncharacterized protein LOC143049932 isoform X2 n=1 Tax=Mytilus galloprovincialis TaxID=29158 RepID=UPI003F7C2456
MSTQAKVRENLTDNRYSSLTDSDRKRKKTERNSLTNKTKIFIGSQYDRWIAIKGEIGATSHTEVAKVLLDRYDGSKRVAAPWYEINASTPAGTSEQHSRITTTHNRISKVTEPDVSEISCSDTEGGHKYIISIDMIDIFQNDDDSEQTSDEDYEPSFNITLRPSTVDNSEEQETEDDDTIEDDKSEEAAIEMGPGVKRLTIGNIDNFITEQPRTVGLQRLPVDASKHTYSTVVYNV